MTSSPDLPAYATGEQLYVDGYAYEVREVHEGGFGIVYLLQSEEPTYSFSYPQFMAAKLFKSAVPLDSLTSELEIWLSLIHPNILQLLKIGMLDFQPAAFAQWRRKGSLHTLLSDQGRLSARNVKAVLIDCISALDYAWREKEVVHLDIKPQNMFQSDVPGRSIQISDWGIAKVTSQLYVPWRSDIKDESPQLTAHFAGTIPYMAPERFYSGYMAGIAADIFSLGVLALQCLTGRLPTRLSSLSLVEQMAKGAYFERATMILASAQLPDDWSKFIRKCIEPDMTARFQNYGQMRYSILGLSEG